MQPLTLEWLVVDKDHVALIFDKLAFSAFHALALARGMETTELITETLGNLFGEVFITRTDVPPYH